MNRRSVIQGLKRVLKKSVLLKGTASAVPKVLCSQRGFSRWGTLFIARGTFSAPSEGPSYESREAAKSRGIHLLWFCSNITVPQAELCQAGQATLPDPPVTSSE
jgi:hypothetical protein